MFGKRVIRSLAKPSTGAPLVSPALTLSRGMRLKIGKEDYPRKTPVFRPDGKIKVPPPNLSSEIGRQVERIVDRLMTPVQVTLSDEEIKKAFESHRAGIDSLVQVKFQQLQEGGYFNLDGKSATEEKKAEIRALKAEAEAEAQQQYMSKVIKELMSKKLAAEKLKTTGAKRSVPATLATIEKEMTFFISYLDYQGDVRRQLNEADPTACEHMLNYIYANMERKLDPATQEVITEVMCQDIKNRVETLGEVCYLLSMQVAYETHKLEYTVTSAEPLSDSIKARIQKAVQARCTSGVSAVAQFEIDPELLGGFKITTPFEEYNFSARKSLDNLLASYHASGRRIQFVYDYDL